MKQKVKGRRILPFLLTLVLIFSLGMTAFAEEEKEGEQKLQTTVVTEEKETADTANTASVDEADRQPVIEDSVEAVQKLIDALPDTVNADNAESVKAQLAAIDEAKAGLSDEELDKLNTDKYTAASKALGSVEEVQTLADTVVAKIGNNEYTTLADAVAEAGTNGVGTEITLVENVAQCDRINIEGKNITIDLNNCGIGFAQSKFFYVKGGTLNLKGTGKVYEENPYFSPVIMKGAPDEQSENFSVVNVGSGVTLQGWSGLFIDNNSGANYGIVANIKGTLIGVKDISGAVGSGLYVNGAISKEGTVPQITLDRATVQAVDGGNGLLLAGYSETKIVNSTIRCDAEGGTGIEIRAGKLTISNSEITGGNGTYKVISNPNGSTSSNVALAVVQHTTKLPIEVIVESGTLSGGAAFVQDNPENIDADVIDKNVKVQIKGGTFAGQVYSANKENFVSGGSFSSEVPGDYCAENFYPNSYVDKTTGKTVYSVHEHKYEWIIDKNPTATEKGIKHEECSVCGDKKAAVEIPAAGANGSDKNNQTTGNRAAVPRTGDNNPLILWGSLFAAAIVVMSGSVIYRRKRF